MFCRPASGWQCSSTPCWTWCSVLLTLPDLPSALRTKQPAWRFSSRACFLLAIPPLLLLDFLWDAVAFKASCWGPRPKPKPGPDTDADSTNRSFPTPAGRTGFYCVGNQTERKIAFWFWTVMSPVVFIMVESALLLSLPLLQECCRGAVPVSWRLLSV